MKETTLEISLIIFTVGLLLSQSTSAGTELEYKSVRSATYVAFTRYRVEGREIARDGQRAFRLLKLVFEQHVNEDGIEADAYKMHVLNLDTEVPDFSHAETVYVTQQGRMPVLLEGFRRGNVGFMLSPHGIQKLPLLFPILPSSAEQIEEGSRWQSSMPPFLVDLGNDRLAKLLGGKVELSAFSTVELTTHWKGSKTILDKRCAELTSSFAVNHDRSGASADFTINSYFSFEIGLPVMVVTEGKGHLLSDSGKLEAFEFFRKEVLVGGGVPFPGRF